MRTLKKMNMDQLAQVMPVISENHQKEFVGGLAPTGTLLSDLWNATPEGTNSTYVNDNSGSFAGDNYSTAYSTGDTISNMMEDFYSSGNPPTGDLCLLGSSGDAIYGEDIWNQSLYRNVSEVNIFESVWSMSQYSKSNSIDNLPKEANAIILDDGQFIFMDIDNNTTTTSSFNYQGIRNTQDGISLYMTPDGVVHQIVGIVHSHPNSDPGYFQGPTNYGNAPDDFTNLQGLGGKVDPNFRGYVVGENGVVYEYYFDENGNRVSNLLE